MKTACCICVSLLITTCIASAQAPAPTGSPPKFQVVRKTVPEKGEIHVGFTHIVIVPVTVQKVVIVNNVQTVVTETRYVPEQRSEEHVYHAAKSQIVNRDGKQLPIDEVWKRLQPNTVIAVSGDSATPSAPFLKALAPETLIIVPPPGPVQPQLQPELLIPPEPMRPKGEPIPPPKKDK
jgi:hypothetical protein